MLRYYLLCIFLFVPRFISAQHVADSLFAAGDLLGARVEYERSIFSGGSPVTVNELLLKKSFCFKAAGDFQSAYQTLQRATETEAQKLRISILYESALTSFLSGKSDLTLGHLEEIKYYFPDTTSQMFQLLEILALNETHQWEKAQQKFQTYSTTYHLDLETTSYADIIKYKPKNPGKAETMSMIIPGSGQMYAGYFLKGLASTAINAGLVLFTVYSFSNGFYASGAFTGVALFYFFYTGGATYARTLTEQKNEHVFRKFNDSIKEQLTKAGGLKK